MVVVKKVDLGRVGGKAEVGRVFEGVEAVEVSAREGWGMEELESAMVELVLGSRGEVGEGMLITRLRHLECVERGLEALEQGEEGLGQGMGYELVAVDVRDAVRALGEIMGEMTPEDVLDRIFEEFCIGK